jgi:hypothetical protein
MGGLGKSHKWITNFYRSFASRYFSRILLLLWFSLVLHGSNASAIDFKLGVGALENGDDRFHGVAVAHMSFSNQWLGQAYYWGRTQKPVTERNTMLTVGKQFDLSGSKSLRTAAGLTYLSETTEIKYADFPEENSKSTNTNGGLFLGVSWELYSMGATKFNVSWEGHLFPAGTAAILLVTGRKQVVALGGGVTF